MEKFKDIWASLISQINERTTNPLTFSFILSWLAWNYKFLIVLFSDMKAPEKLSVIELKYSEWNIAWQSGFIYPLLTALIYVFIYPYVTDIVVRFYRARQISLANSVKNIEKKRLLTHEDANMLRRSYEGQLAKISQAESDAQVELNSARQALASAEDEINSLKANKPISVENLLIKDRQVDINVSIPTHLRSGFENISERDVSDSQTTKSDRDTLIRLSGNHSNIQEKNRSLTRSKLKILTALSKGEELSVSELVQKIGEKTFFIQSDLDELSSSALIQRITSTGYILSSNGRAVLKVFVKEGKWTLD